MTDPSEYVRTRPWGNWPPGGMDITGATPENPRERPDPPEAETEDEGSK